MARTSVKTVPALISGTLTDIDSTPELVLNHRPGVILINLANTGAALTDFALVGRASAALSTYHTLISGATWGTVAGILKNYVGALNTLASGSSAFAHVDIGPMYDVKFQAKIANGARCAGTLTLAVAVPVADETVTIGSAVYTWKAAPTTVANQVKIGATMAASCVNLAAAINAGSGSGTLYGSDTVAHTQVSAAESGDTVVVTALASITAAVGTLIATTETMTNGSWGATTLADGITTAVTVTAVVL